MSYVKTEKDVKEYFPFGALLVRDDSNPIKLTSLSVVEGPTGPVLVGWSYPNKNFNLELSNVLHQKDGWLVFSGGQRVVLRPLSEEVGKKADAMMDGV